MKINLITWDGKPWFTNRIPTYPNIEFYENNYEDIEWDILAVFENTVIPTSSFKTKCTILLSGEPPLACVYPKGYLNQFDAVITSNPSIKHKNVIHKQPAEPIFLGRSWATGEFTTSFSDLVNITKPHQLRPISLMSSTLSHLPGHKKRLKLVNAVINAGFPIDIFGRGRKYVDDKIDALLPYMFHICIENDSLPEYFSEKIVDPIIAYCVPIYYGCINIEKYIDPSCMYIVKSEDELINTIRTILKNPSEAYCKKLKALTKERENVLNKINIIETITPAAKDNCDIKLRVIRSKESFSSYLYLNIINKIHERLLTLLS